jgi:large subunit ribosomal protein L41
MRPTQQLLKKYRHLRLTTKDINKGFYKGNRTGTIGSHTKHGGFIVDYSRVRTYVVPQGLKDFKVRFPPRLQGLDMTHRRSRS